MRNSSSLIGDLLRIVLRTQLQSYGRPRRRRRRGVLVVLFLTLFGATGYYGNVFGWWGPKGNRAARATTPVSATATPPSIANQRHAPSSAEEDIATLAAQKRANVLVTTEGKVERMLPDDQDGERHQCWILRVSESLTVKIAHNIDIASRVPLDAGMSIRVHGEYIWNDQGGVIHWTHHDPDGKRPGGWVEVAGKRYE